MRPSLAQHQKPGQGRLGKPLESQLSLQPLLAWGWGAAALPDADISPLGRVTLVTLEIWVSQDLRDRR